MLNITLLRQSKQLGKTLKQNTTRTAEQLNLTTMVSIVYKRPTSTKDSSVKDG